MIVISSFSLTYCGNTTDYTPTVSIKRFASYLLNRILAVPDLLFLQCLQRVLQLRGVVHADSHATAYPSAYTQSLL
jgi:hypothetical protein